MLLLLPKFDSGRDLVYNLLKQNVMAKSENVIRGRIGNMIFYRVRGVTRIRSVPLSTGKPDSSTNVRFSIRPGYCWCSALFHR